MAEDEKIKFILELGKAWIARSSLGNLDRTAYIFVTTLQEMNAKKEAEELYEFYNHS